MTYEAIGAIGALAAILGALFKVIAKLNAQMREYEKTRTLAIQNDETGKLLLRASIAILDGLKQKGCNGKVTEMHETLIRYAVDK